MVARVTIAFIAAVALTIIPAVFQGYYENRWADPAEMAAAAKQVEQIPTELGDWKVTSEGEPMHEVVVTDLGLAGYVTRTYTDQKTGHVVSLLLMVGQSGPLIRHPPYVCYANRANEQVGDMTKLEVDVTKPTSEFNLLEYKRPDSVTNDRFLVAYSMSKGSHWLAPEMPRVVFGGAPLVYKVQMLLALNPDQDREAGNAILKRFAREFCAAFEKYVEPSAPAPKA